ncbi:MAG TPA: CAP domain-containing protein [Acidobacteriaceae bacterium]
MLAVRVFLHARLALVLMGLVCCLAVAAQTPSGDRGVVGDPPAPAAEPGSLLAQPDDVQTLFRLMNEFRAGHGLAAFAWSPPLAAAARAHAGRMAAAGSGLSHRYDDEPDLATRASAAGAHFSSIAENIAQGYGAEAIAKQWITSVPHSANLLDPRMNAVGIAMVHAGSTRYAVEDLAAAFLALDPPAVQRQVEEELRGLERSSAGGREWLVLGVDPEQARHV